MKKIVYLICFTTLLSALLSCSKKNDTIVVDIFQFKVEIQDALQKSIAQYKTLHPNIEIKLTSVGGGSDYGAALKSRFASGEEPTIFNIGGPQDLADWEGVVADLTDLELSQKALPGTLDAVSLNGRSYALPYNIEGYGLIYNTEIFKRAGLENVEIQNFLDLKDVVETLDSQKESLGLDAVLAFPAKETWVTGLHTIGHFISPEFEGSVNSVHNAKTVAFQYGQEAKNYFDLQGKYSAKPIVSLDYSTQVEKLYSNGKVAIIQQGNWAYGSIVSVNPDIAASSDLLPIPIGETANYPMGVPNYWAVNARLDAEVQKAATDFLTWLYTSDEGKNIVLDQFNFIPAYTGYDSSRISDPISRRILQASESGNTSNWVFMGFPTNWGMGIFGSNLQLYYNDALSWEDLLFEAQDEWKKSRAF